MEAGIVALLTGVITVIIIILKIYTGPSGQERKRQKEKLNIDEALRKKDKVTVSDILSQHRDRLAAKLRGKGGVNS